MADTESPRSFSVRTTFPGLVIYADGTDGPRKPAEELRIHVELSAGSAAGTATLSATAVRVGATCLFHWTLSTTP